MNRERYATRAAETRRLTMAKLHSRQRLLEKHCLSPARYRGSRRPPSRRILMHASTLETLALTCCSFSYERDLDLCNNHPLPELFQAAEEGSCPQSQFVKPRILDCFEASSPELRSSMHSVAALVISSHQSYLNNKRGLELVLIWQSSMTSHSLIDFCATR